MKRPKLTPEARKERAKAIRMITQLYETRQGEELTLDKVYQIVARGQQTLTLAGPRGARYCVVPCPRVTVMEAPEAPVYAIIQRGRSRNFALVEGRIEWLKRY